MIAKINIDKVIKAIELLMQDINEGIVNHLYVSDSLHIEGLYDILSSTRNSILSVYLNENELKLLENYL